MDCGQLQPITYFESKIVLPKSWVPVSFHNNKLDARCAACVKKLPLLTITDCHLLSKAAPSCYTIVLSPEDYLALRKINFNPQKQYRVHLHQKVPVSLVLLGSREVYDGTLVGEWRELRGLKPVDARWSLEG